MAKGLFGWRAWAVAATVAFSSLLCAQEAAVPNPASSPSCPPTVAVTAVTPTPDGLLLATTGPIEGATLRQEAISAPGYETYWTLTLTLPGARLAGPPSRLTWSSGPFSELRAFAYAEGGGCGLRLRLVPRSPQVWIVTPQPGGLLLAVRPQPAPRREEGTMANESRKSRYAGAVTYTGSLASSTATGTPTYHTGQGQVGFAQNLGDLGTLEGFASQLSPHQGLSTPYGAAALTNLHLGPLWSEWAAGDLETGLGFLGTGASLPETLLFRGGGATLLFPGRVGLQLFGGRAAQSEYQRLPGELQLVTDLSSDHLYGLQATWSTPKGLLEAGAGVLRSVAHTGLSHTNLFQSFTLTLAPRSSFRLTAEESRLDAGTVTSGSTQRSGYALTFEPTVASANLDVGGYYRLLSGGFRPPFGSNVFADYRHSYNLYASYHPKGGWFASASGGQSRSYNYFDPTQAGTLSTFTSGSVGYAFTSHFSLSADVSRSTSRSDPGVLNPTDSTTHDAGLTAAFALNRLTSSIMLTREKTDDAVTPSLGITSTRLDWDSAYQLSDAQNLQARLRYYDAKRPSGERISRYYDGQFSWRGLFSEAGQFAVQAGYTLTPAGVSQFESRQLSAGVSYQTGRWLRKSSLGLSLSYYRLDITGQPSRRGVIAQVSLGGLFGWGQPPQPLPPFASRSLIMGQAYTQQSPTGLLVVQAFEDDNGDGRREKGEAGVGGLWVSVDGESVQTSAGGDLSLRLAPGRHEVELLPKGVVFSYVVERAAVSLSLPPQGRVVVELPLRPAGKLSGRLRFTGEGLLPGELAGIRLQAKGVGFERETTSGPGGRFAFGVLPAGEVLVTLDRTTVPPSLWLESAPSERVRVVKGGESEVLFTLRRATAKERIFGTPGSDPVLPKE